MLSVSCPFSSIPSHAEVVECNDHGEMNRCKATGALLALGWNL